MSPHISFPLTIVLICQLLVSCASVTQQTEKETPVARQPAGWAAEKEMRQQINNWEIRGRLGLQTDKTGGTMDIVWKQANDDYTIRLLAPLGAGSYMIQGGKDFAEIRFPDGEKQVVDNVDDVFASALEVDLPASAVKDWVRGLPAGALPVKQVEWNEQGLIKRIKQSGWNVEMTNYSGVKVSLPHKIYLSRDDDDALDVRLILRQWLIDN
ncbi:MAG: lipoprotein insertase outer membrane protein LolB [Gammaproteobacteria bacterium]|nr:lipoprotein insertase outer membrane protein LolB [Gammaproteobacteria bacterium]MBT8134821.1 lipoprotein insertase outer membrane protein LolB [Gammaproteobacteria bacterium]NNJ50962.1 outer membrane lipoprotein LolB [Gammaproteobacteria bacterium]